MAAVAKKWGDLEWEQQNEDEENKVVDHDDEDDEDMPLPPRTETEPDENGIKIVTEYLRDEKNRKVKITKRVRVQTMVHKVNKNVMKRRRWKKFGDVAGAPPGPEPNITYRAFDNVVLDLRKGKTAEDDEEKSGIERLVGNKTGAFKCSHCGEQGHFSMKCPKRGELRPSGMSDMDLPPPPSSDNKDATGSTGKYVPPHIKRGKDGTAYRDRDDAATLRVTNLSEDTTEDDLKELFRPFGRTTRIYLAKDRTTNASRGFAFVNYEDRDDAARAIEKLNGHGYDNLILHVEWAKPRDDK